MVYQHKLSVTTPGRGTVNVTDDIQRQVAAAGIDTGVCNVFLHHTSASLILCENADPTVRRDLEAFMQRLAPDGDPLFKHTDEGPDDMPAHVRSIVTHNSLSLPVTNGRCGLGVWQGVYLYEHRYAPHTRRLTVTVYG